MRKLIILSLSSLLLLSSCGTYTGTGAYVGGQFGTILGSAIGGISGGPRGSDFGSIVGMAGGAAVGAAIGAAADKAQADKISTYQSQRQQRLSQERSSSADDSGFDAANSADDRISFDAAGPQGASPRTYTVGQPRALNPSADEVEPGYSVHYNSLIEIRNARIVDADRDGVIRAGEQCTITFEIMNRSDRVLYDVQPTVVELSNNKHLHISPNLHVESIAPNTGVRYTATVLADRKLRDGTAVIRVGVTQGNKQVTSQMQEFTLPTRRR